MAATRPRQCPADFEATFVELGAVYSRDHYGVGRETIAMWLAQCGSERLRELRAQHVAQTVVPWGETRSRPVRDCPPDFDLAYTTLGLKGCCRRYAAGWRTIVRWRNERGAERLIAARDKHMKGYAPGLSLGDVGRMLSKAYPVQMPRLSGDADEGE